MSEVIILAGGLGTRLRSVVADVPKPLAPVAGRPFLEHLVDRWIAAGATRIVLSVGYRRELIERHFGDAYGGVPVDYAVEERPLGTGGGLLLAAARLRGEGAFFAANGDTFFAVDVAAMRRAHEAKHADLTMALHQSTDRKRYTPVDLDAEGRIRTLRLERRAAPAWVNGGVYLIGRGVLESAGLAGGSRVSLEDELLPVLLGRGARLVGFPSEAPFIDIGIPEDYARAGAVVAAAR